MGKLSDSLLDVCRCFWYLNHVPRFSPFVHQFVTGTEGVFMGVEVSEGSVLPLPSWTFMMKDDWPRDLLDPVHRCCSVKTAARWELHHVLWGKCSTGWLKILQVLKNSPHFLLAILQGWEPVAFQRSLHGVPVQLLLLAPPRVRLLYDGRLHQDVSDLGQRGVDYPSDGNVHFRIIGQEKWLVFTEFQTYGDFFTVQLCIPTGEYNGQKGVHFPSLPACIHEGFR